LEDVVSEKTKSLMEAVGSQISAFGPAVQEGVISHFVEKEKKRRIEALISGLDQAKSYSSELKKLSKPDVITKNLDGTTKDESFSPAAAKKFAETKQKADKLDKAMDKAFNGEFGDLFQLVAKGGGEAAPAEAAE
jgi:hypothetical protein